MMQESFKVTKQGYQTTREMTYLSVTVPEGFVFDGITIKRPWGILFSNIDLFNGLRAAAFHDYMCKNKEHYRRSFATDVLVAIWREDGLCKSKACIVKFCVNLFQRFKGWDRWVF